MQKVQPEGCFIIISSYLNRKNKKSEDLVYSKFKGIVKKKFVENFFKDRDSSNFTGGLDKEGLDSVEYGNQLA